MISNNNILFTPIEYAKGVGPVKAELLKKELNIFTFNDLIYYYPFRYIDKSKFYKINEINSENLYVQIKGKFIAHAVLGEKRTKRLVATFFDETGSIDLVWFNYYKSIEALLNINNEYIVFGKPSQFNGRYNIVHPEISIVNVEEHNDDFKVIFQPFYNSSEKLKSRGLDNKGIAKISLHVLRVCFNYIVENLSNELILKHQLLSHQIAIENIHFPQNIELIDKAQFRLKYEELFFLQLKLVNLKLVRKEKIKGFVFGLIGEKFNSLYKEYLPFELTNAQKKVLKEIREDLRSGKQMNRLVQGDVGSGKTIVALMSMMIAIDNSFQACIMAPTEILATQHYNSIKKLCDNVDVTVELLTGSTKKSARKKILADLLSGDLKIVVGTHALIEDTVQFKKLGIAVIDEQHRFGVAQRARLWDKTENKPHVLVMTATPIPRTLAMTLYGDLDVSVINELPPGRKPIKTMHTYDNKRASVYQFMKEQIASGRQIYVVYPLIKESEALDLKFLNEGFEQLSIAFPLPQYAISVVHGQLKPQEKDFEMERFKKGETQILIATTVIEVGVDVPNASVIIIENAERFGLAQLHQLRGRVGRGAEQSYCILISSEKLTESGRKRMKTMVATNDGFKIAEEDLKLRGPGDIDGTQQSGMLELKIADITTDEKILTMAREDAIDILTKDPELSLEQNKPIKLHYEKLYKSKVSWSNVS